MAEYKPAFDITVRNEDPTLSGKVMTDNNGGKVRYGLNSKAHPDLESSGYYLLDADLALTYAQGYYHDWYWQVIRGDVIANQAVANKVFDQSVVMGIHDAVVCLQRSMLMVATQQILVQDGVLGPMSMKSLNAQDPLSFLTRYKSQLTRHYRLIVLAHSEDITYLNGWLDRVSR